ncbi:hypothetical protein TNCV_3913191 [Trichonephila clavipes]|nr:hypothetical protein TNCV_3913191 [Trichonephila clavipes]
MSYINIAIYRVICYQTDKLAECVWVTETTRKHTWECGFASAVVASYGTKKQRKRKERASHEWDRRHFVEGLFYNTCSEEHGLLLLASHKV